MKEISGEEYRATKGAVSLYLWRKRSADRPPSAARPPIVLVHGSSLSGRPSYDLTVPGHPDYSFMDWLAARGWDVWTLDHEGYGHSTITDGNSDIASGVADLVAATDLIAGVTGSRAVHAYGLSSGSLRAAGFAQAAPDRVARLVLDAFVWTGKGSPTLSKRREGIEFFRANNRRPIDRKFIESIFTRDLPGTSDPAVVVACADAREDAVQQADARLARGNERSGVGHHRDQRDLPDVGRFARHIRSGDHGHLVATPI